MRVSALFLALALVLVLVPVTSATYYDGYVNSDGYAWHNGYWWKSNVSYSREQYQSPGYYYCGVYYPGSYYYKYYQYTPPATATPTTVPYTADWKSQVLRVAAARDDHNAYLQTLKVLGLPLPPDQGPVPFGVPFNGLNIGRYGMGTYGSSVQLGSYGASGNTLYGYSYNQLKDPYGDASLNTLYQQAARLTGNAQTLAGQAHVDFTDLVAKEGGNRAEVAKILARAAAAEKALKATESSSSQVTVQEQRSFVFPDNGNLPLMPPANDPGGAKPSVAWKAIASTDCIACHGGNKKEGGFDVNSYPAMTPAQKLVVWQRLATLDPDKAMPKGRKGAYPQEKLAEWIRN